MSTEPKGNKSQLKYIQNTFGANETEGCKQRMMRILQSTNTLEKLSLLLVKGAQDLRKSKIQSGLMLHEKFKADGNCFELDFKGLTTFYSGLEGLIGPPQSNLIEGMKREHCKSIDSQRTFVGVNYGTSTRSEIEWWFVYQPAKGLEELKLDEYPSEPHLRETADDDEAAIEAKRRLRRTALPIESFAEVLRAKDAQLRDNDTTALMDIEFYGARLYSGPMYVKYNAVLRGCHPHTKPEIHGKWVQLCGNNKYTTTLHTINSSIVKLGKLTRAAKVYRGVSKGLLPKAFWTANAFNVKGGVDFGFTSTSLDMKIAMEYASNGGVVFVIQMGMLDRGADIGWLSQYPLEKEIVFPPMTGIEVQETRVDGEDLVVEVRMTINLNALTIEQVVGKMQASHIQLVQILEDNFKFGGAPKTALAPLHGLKLEAKRQSPYWFNVPENFLQATTQALNAQRQVISLLEEPEVWLGNKRKKNSKVVSSGASVVDSIDSSFVSHPGSAGGADDRDIEEFVIAQETNAVDAEIQQATLALSSAEMKRLERHRNLAANMVSTASVCAGMEHTTTSVKLLMMATDLYPLKERDEKLAKIVERAINAAEAERDPMDNSPLRPVRDGRARLEASMLTNGAMQPWPRTLVRLAMEERIYAAGTYAAFAAITKSLVTRDPFGVGAPVIAYRRPTEKMAGGWFSGVIKLKLPENCFAVTLRTGETIHELEHKHVLSADPGGPGAILREAAAAHAIELVRALLEKGISVHFSDMEANTALHVAAAAGYYRVAKQLVDRNANGMVPNMRKLTPFDLAIMNGHTRILRLFHPYASDEEVTEFAYKGSPLLKASHDGDLALVKTLVAEKRMEQESARERVAGKLSDAAHGAYLAAQEKDFRNFLNDTADHEITPLMLAAKSGHSEVVKYLLCEQADLLLTSSKGCTAIRMMTEAVVLHSLHRKREAARAARKTPSKWLSHPVELLGKDARLVEMSETLLEMIEVDKTRRAEYVEKVLEGETMDDVESTIDLADEYGLTPLMIAVDHSDEDVMRVFLDNGANVNKQLVSGTTALYMACRDGHTKCAEILLENSAEVNTARVSDGETPLIAAATYGHAGAMKLLLSHGADMNEETKLGETALMKACTFGHLPIVEILLDSNVDLDREDKKGPNGGDDSDSDGGGDDANRNGRGPNYGAGQKYNRDSVSYNSALHCAAAAGHERIVNLLIVNEDDVDKVRSMDKQSPLMVAAAGGNVAVCATLLRQGANVNYKRPPPHCDTALMVAAVFGQHEVVEELLQTLMLADGVNDADAASSHSVVSVEEKDMSGRTALHLAVESGRLEVVRVLMRAGANVNTTNASGLTPLHSALQLDDVDMVKCLMVAKNVNVDDESGTGVSPLAMLRRQSTAGAKKWKAVFETIRTKSSDGVSSRGSTHSLH